MEFAENLGMVIALGIGRETVDLAAGVIRGDGDA